MRGRERSERSTPHSIASRCALLLLVRCGGCGDPQKPPPSCPPDAGFIGDPEAAPDIEVGEFHHSDGEFRPIVADGEALTLYTPPQGGKIVLVGALVQNMVPCNVIVTSRLRHPTAEGEPVAVREGREIKYEPIDGRDGWGAPRTVAEDPLDLAPNVPACFNYADRDMYGCEWILEVSAEDLDGRYVEKRFRVVPQCLEGDPNAEPGICECECAASYVDGRCDDPESWIDREPVCE